MIIATRNITFANAELTLTNQRVLFWKACSCLVLSDIHIGKTAHFRQHGIAVSDAVLDKDLERLQMLIQHFNPKQIIVVGDLFHANYNSNIAYFKSWLAQFDVIEKILIRGNHDRFNTLFYEELNFKTFEKLTINKITFVHDIEPTNTDENYISGHTHPGVLLQLKGRQKIKLPCFHVNKNQLVLSAFSLFTGLNTNSKLENSVSYGFTDDAIFKCISK